MLREFQAYFQVAKYTVNDGVGYTYDHTPGDM